TVDTAGNLLLPMDWRGVLVNPNAVPVPRLLRGSTPLEAFAGTGTPVRIPGAAFLASFTPEGRKLPPIFDPQADPTDPSATTFFGSADAPASVLRIARRVPILLCAGGAQDGSPCATPRDCPGGTCTPTFHACANGTHAGAPCAADAVELCVREGRGDLPKREGHVPGAGPEWRWRYDRPRGDADRPDDRADSADWSGRGAGPGGGADSAAALQLPRGSGGGGRGSLPRA